MATTYIKQHRKLEQVWDAHQQSKKEDKPVVSALDIALALLEEYAAPSKRFVQGHWNAHYAKAVQQAISEYKVTLGNSANAEENAHKLINAVAEYVAETERKTGDKSRLGLIMRSIMAHTNVQSAKAQEVFGKEIPQSQAIKALKLYSANWLVRLFTGGLKNKHVKLVRKALKNFDAKQQTTADLMKSIVILAVQQQADLKGDKLATLLFEIDQMLGLNNYAIAHFAGKEAVVTPSVVAEAKELLAKDADKFSPQDKFALALMPKQAVNEELANLRDAKIAESSDRFLGKKVTLEDMLGQQYAQKAMQELMQAQRAENLQIVPYVAPEAKPATKSVESEVETRLRTGSAPVAPAKADAPRQRAGTSPAKLLNALGGSAPASEKETTESSVATGTAATENTSVEQGATGSTTPKAKTPATVSGFFSGLKNAASVAVSNIRKKMSPQKSSDHGTPATQPQGPK